ncbi:hypothetical protein FS749_012122 [Ceratobasidium sp. UAMH 11750]|nr:hypothetical protein FS749_012122 [Ceratobasidium sp. UAMH 11750]
MPYGWDSNHPFNHEDIFRPFRIFIDRFPTPEDGITSRNAFQLPFDSIEELQGYCHRVQFWCLTVNQILRLWAAHEGLHGYKNYFAPAILQSPGLYTAVQHYQRINAIARRANPGLRCFWEHVPSWMAQFAPADLPFPNTPVVSTPSLDSGSEFAYYPDPGLPFRAEDVASQTTPSPAKSLNPDPVASPTSLYSSTDPQHLGEPQEPVFPTLDQSASCFSTYAVSNSPIPNAPSREPSVLESVDFWIRNSAHLAEAPEIPTLEEVTIVPAPLPSNIDPSSVISISSTSSTPALLSPTPFNFDRWAETPADNQIWALLQPLSSPGSLGNLSLPSTPVLASETEEDMDLEEDYDAGDLQQLIHVGEQQFLTPQQAAEMVWQRYGLDRSMGAFTRDTESSH